MKAIVISPVCALLAAPTRESTLVDEALYGMVVDSGGTRPRLVPGAHPLPL